MKRELKNYTLDLALDYIFHNNNRTSVEAYNESERKNLLRVKFKNAIMMKWSEIKEKKPKGNMQDMINQLIKQKNESKKDGVDFAN